MRLPWVVPLPNEVGSDPILSRCVFVDLKPNPTPTISAEQLANEYAADNKATIAKYNKKTMIVTGQLKSKTAPSGQQSVNISLKGNDKYWVYCRCFAFDSFEADKYQIGQAIAVLGIFDEEKRSTAKAVGFDGCYVITRPEKPGRGRPASKHTDMQSLHKRFADGPDETLLQLVKENPTLVDDMDPDHCTALHYAARYSRVETARWLIEHKADVNTVSYNEFTPMHMVSDGTIAQLLIAGGADLKMKDSWGKTPLQNAAVRGRKDVGEAILASGFPSDLASVIWLGKRDLAKKMIQENPEIAKQAEGGSDLWTNTTPLGAAATEGDKELVELLLKAGAPVNAVTERPGAGHLTALSNAVTANQYEIAEILCKAGADCNVSAGKFYSTLLDYAIMHSEEKMVELLKKHGGKRSERN